MDKIRLDDKTFKPYISEEQIQAAIDKVADQMNANYKECKEIPILLCVLNGSIMFTAELMKRLKFDCELVSIKLSSYNGGLQTSGKVKQMMGLTASVADRTVIIVEDIVDSGKTIVALQEILKEQGAKKTEVCTLLQKPDALVEDISLDYVAMEIENKFIVGFGLDYKEIGRNFPSLYIIEEDE